MLPLVSILIPNFNKSPFLKDTLKSVLNQSYENWECIIVDDHSTDNSWEILQEFAELDSRITVVRRPDNLVKGPSSCRNFAFSLSSGEYIQYLDSDDQLSPAKLERQINQAVNSNRKDVFISNWAVTELGNHAELTSLERFNTFPLNPLDLVIRCWTDRTFMPLFAYLFPRDLINESGGWSETLKKNDDGEFSCRILANASLLHYDNIGYGLYVKLPTSGHLSEDNSLEAITSKWNSFLSYEKVIRAKRFDNVVKIALVHNYQHIFLLALNLAPAISKEALIKIRLLEKGLKINYLFFMRVFLVFGFDIGYRLYKIRMKLF
jgi:glycosyltransferase involved in cell wall biosynthesis